jgi:hypothetical protein
MKFDCDRHYKWHKWFAWRPVRLGDSDCRWLEIVERKKVKAYGCHWRTDYRPING